MLLRFSVVTALETDSIKESINESEMDIQSVKQAKKKFPGGDLKLESFDRPPAR